MALFSFHGGHSGEYCRHAKDNLELIVKRAIELGFSSFGMTEHAPIYATENLYFDQRDQTPEQIQADFDRFLDEACSLREKYRDQIDLFVGFETEVIPAESYVEKMLAIKADPRVEYCVGSVHHLDSMELDISEEGLSKVEDAFGGKHAMERRYFEDLGKMISEIKPTVVAHFDLIRKYRGEDYSFDAPVWRNIEHALEAAKEYGCILDINCALKRKGTGDVYPSSDILRRAFEMDIPVTLGDDSHSVADVGGALLDGVDAAASAGYRELMCACRDGDEMIWRGVGLGQI